MYANTCPLAVPAPGALPVHNWQCAPCPWVHEGSLHMGVQEVSYFKDCLLWSRKGEGPAPPLSGIPTDSKCTGWRAHCTQRAVDRKRVFFFFMESSLQPSLVSHAPASSTALPLSALTDLFAFVDLESPGVCKPVHTPELHRAARHSSLPSY